MIKLITNTFLLIAISSNFLFAKNTAKIIGNITDSENKPVELAYIFLEDMSIGSQSDKHGNYELDAPLGTHKLVLRMPGYKTIKQIIEVKDSNDIRLNFTLKLDLLQLDKVVVTATRNYLDRKQAPIAVSVATARMLEATNSVSLVEGLNYQPGLMTETNCQNCGFSQVRINGLEGAYSQILVNSQPIFSTLNSIYGLDQIPMNMIKEIEIVRGGGSSLYGANAIAGTINIITKDPETNSFGINQKVSLMNLATPEYTTMMNGSVVGDSNNAGFSYFGLFKKKDPMDYNGDGFSEIPMLENKSFGFKSFVKPLENSKLTMEFNTLSEFRRGGNKLHLEPFEADAAEQIVSDVYSGNMSFDIMDESGIMHSNSYASFSSSKNRNYYGGGEDLVEQEGKVLGFGKTKNEIFLVGTKYSHKIPNLLFGKGTITGGFEFKHEIVEDQKKNLDAEINQTLKNYGTYVQQEWEKGDIKILLGLRGDIDNFIEKKIILSSRLNIMYSIHEDSRLRLSYSEGFLSPRMFTEDIHQTLAVGELTRVELAPNLKPEKSASYLASIDWGNNYGVDEFYVLLEGFYTQLYDSFVLEDITGNRKGRIFQKKNGGTSHIKGLNLELKYAPNIEWQIQLGGTLQEGLRLEPTKWSEELSTTKNDSKFFRSPNLYGNFAITYAPTKDFQNNITGTYLGSMYVPHMSGFIEKDKLEETPDFWVLNLKSSYNIHYKDILDIEFSGGVLNVLDSFQQDSDKGPDKDAAYIYGPSKPRTIFAGIKISTH
ncbi:TonB-dependent receptor [Ichthyobacterium seriolicida]|uniref:TonB-dependent receptor outer membrane receptor for ferrienterochelin and colicins n=1 Tax=Ichthyobacterium seriolicida TaxID=242600 RepID=A0A1J1E841_9FLAO|nr:TonB-dependent receptor [Ichthyobacterium seriolicida]BAV94099.1 TonB-dependent receptor; outer membrane receptor for ferrienterochelin and colicins [Ichthyobacterium seriolicida]